MKKLDCTKITSIEEIALILEGLIINISDESEYFEKLKHLIVDKD